MAWAAGVVAAELRDGIERNWRTGLFTPEQRSALAELATRLEGRASRLRKRSNHGRR
jgi:hypothetical protein